MKKFAEVLDNLPPVDHLQAIELYRAEQHLDSIPNQPGKRGSLAVYHALLQRFGQLDAEAARAGLALFAEHAQDAERHPGKHPNIDRLQQVIAQDDCLQLRPIAQTGEQA